MDFVIVAPFEEAVTQNGAPTGFCTVDTYWSFGADEPMSLGKLKLVKPAKGLLSDGEFTREEGQVIHYKTVFNEDDRLAFINEFLLEGGDVTEAKMDALNDVVFNLEKAGISSFSHDFYIETSEDIANLERLFLSADGADQIKIDQVIKTTLRDSAVHKALSGFGCPLRECGKDYWCHDFKNEGEGDVAAEVGAKHFGKHVYSASYELEAMMNGKGPNPASAVPLATKEDVLKFIDENQSDLPAKTVELATSVVHCDVYHDARNLRVQALSLAQEKRLAMT